MCILLLYYYTILLLLLLLRSSSSGSCSRDSNNNNINNNNFYQYNEVEFKDLKHDNVHKLMSEQDLRRTFQVNSHDQVPEYEILKLTVNEDGSHLISPISDLGELTTATATTTTTTRTQQPNSSNSNSKQHTSDQQTVDSANSSAGKSNSNDNHNFADEKGDEKLIVMKLSTFGRDFKLRLKRNVDFQQRIKDMKMFMAESTKDGQLRYTEIKSGQHKQEPHKRSAQPGSEELLQSQASEPNIGQESEKNKPSSSTKTTTTTTTTSTTIPPPPPPPPTTTTTTTTATESKSKSTTLTATATASAATASSHAGLHSNIGSTYHDEDNLAALLIDHDSRTGQLQVDGTIGNDFVIKPMPQSTLQALKAKQQEQSLRQQQQQQPSGVNNNDAVAADPQPIVEQQQQPTLAAANASAALLDQLHHHDDPHDDDEMFLDEDEALELAHLRNDSSRTARQSEGGAQADNKLKLPQQQQQQQQQQEPSPRSLSKAASERKWKKYRKLVAQTQVPKPGAALAGAASSVEHSAAQAAQPQRARRHTRAPPEVLATVSHHIVYKQRPSSESSSREHQRSVLASPGDLAAQLEQMALSFAPVQRLNKREAAQSVPSDGDNMIDNLGRLVQLPSSRLARPEGADGAADTDAADDPLDGQFYLEPATMTGSARAGHADWSLVAPYAALNDSSCANSTTTTTTTGANGQQQHGRRHKRQAAPMRAQAPHMRASQVRRKRQAPDTVWPEVLLVVDYDSFLLHGGDSRDVKRYFVSFWNGVDLRYKLLVHPHIRISLAGMIVAKDRDATPYLERNRLRAPNADAVDAAGALTDMGKYLYREDRLPTYDLAVVITKLDMCRRRFEGGRCNRGTAGFAYVGGACVVNKRLEKVNSVAIIEDSGGFSGIIVAAHEVGHLLGCVHDGSPPPSYLGGPGATHCPWEDGFIMSDLRHTERGFRWSQCSVEQFKHFLNGETATCLYNYPHESQMLHRLLPGTMLSLDEQCKRDRGTNACFKDARVCAQLFCFDSASGYCVSYRPAAEGSPCGEGQVCRNGKCVGEIENIIPDYTHQTQTVVAAARRAPTAGGVHLGVSRLADNGLSASSTSTATSSPDSKQLPVAVAAAAASPSSSSSVPQLSSRMDTFAVDTPLVSVNPYGSFGGRYSPAQVISNGNNNNNNNNNNDDDDAGGFVLMRQAASSPSRASTTISAPTISGQAKRMSAKLTASTTSALTDPFNGNKQGQQYQQRSGHQAIPKMGANQSSVKPSSSTSSSNHHRNYPHSSSGSSTSSSTMSYHQYPSSTNSNLLTSNSQTHQVASSSGSSGSGNNSNMKLYDNQRTIMYQPQERQQYQSNFNHPVNRIVNPYLINSNPDASASEQLYSSLAPNHHHQHQLVH